MSWTLLAPFVWMTAVAAPDYAMHQQIAEDGPRALARPMVAWSLQLSTDQRAEIARIKNVERQAKAELAVDPTADDEMAVTMNYLQRTVLTWQTEFELLTVLDAAQLKRVEGPLGVYRLAQLPKREKQDLLAMYDPLRVERISRVA